MSKMDAAGGWGQFSAKFTLRHLMTPPPLCEASLFPTREGRANESSWQINVLAQKGHTSFLYPCLSLELITWPFLNSEVWKTVIRN